VVAGLALPPLLPPGKPPDFLSAPNTAATAEGRDPREVREASPPRGVVARGEERPERDLVGWSGGWVVGWVGGWVSCIAFRFT
jgi:hypothetical protein